MALGYVVRTHVFLLAFIYPILALDIGHRVGGHTGALQALSLVAVNAAG